MANQGCITIGLESTRVEKLRKKYGRIKKGGNVCGTAHLKTLNEVKRTYWTVEVYA